MTTVHEVCMDSRKSSITTADSSFDRHPATLPGGPPLRPPPMVPKKRERASSAPSDAPHSAPNLKRASKIPEEAVSFDDWPQPGHVIAPKSAGIISNPPIKSSQKTASALIPEIETLDLLLDSEKDGSRNPRSPKFLPPLDIPVYESLGDPFAGIGRISFLDTSSKPNSPVMSTPPPPVPPKSPRDRRSISPIRGKIAMIHMNGSAATLVNNSRSATPSTPQEDRASPRSWEHGRDDNPVMEQRPASEIPRTSPLRQSERRDSTLQTARKELPKSARQSIRQRSQKSPAGIRNRASATEQTIVSAVLREKTVDHVPRDLLSTYDISTLSRVSVRVSC